MEMLFLAMLVATAVTRYGVTDLVATVKGTESPRHRERAQRAQLAHEREMTRLRNRHGPTIGEAVAGRIAHRIAEPKPPRDRSGQRPARAYFGRLWEDSWNDAVHRHDRRHERAQAGDLPRQRAARKAQEAVRLRWQRYQSRRDQHAGEGQGAAAWTAERTDPGAAPSRDDTAGPPAPQDVVDAEVVDDEPQHDPRCRDGLIGGRIGCPDCIEVLRRDGHEGTDQQLEAMLIDRHDGYTDEPGDEDDSGIERSPDAARWAGGPAVEHDRYLVTDDRGTIRRDWTSTRAEAEEIAARARARRAELWPDGNAPGELTIERLLGSDPEPDDEDPDPPPTPAAAAPLATVHPIAHNEGDITTMTAPSSQNLASGETVDPESAKAFSDGIGHVANQLYAELETSEANLTELGVTGGPIERLASMKEAAETLVTASAEASEYFSGHADIAEVAQSDETVGGGRYIGIGS